MLLVSLIDGLTTQGSIYNKGDVFRLAQNRLGEVKGKSDEKIAKDLKKTYGRAIYRKATQEEIIVAIRAGKIAKVAMDLQDKREKKALATALRDKADKQNQAADLIEESIEDGDDEEAEAIIDEVVEEPEEPEEEVIEEPKKSEKKTTKKKDTKKKS